MNPVANWRYHPSDIEEEKMIVVSKVLPDSPKKQQLSMKKQSILLNSFLNRPQKLGVYTRNELAAAGFECTGNGSTAFCKDCKLEISYWTPDMKPMAIHLEQRPDCPFVINLSKALPSLILNTASPNDQENPSKRIKVESNDFDFSLNTLHELDLLVQVRRRTFSHWPHRIIRSREQMINAGFFNCNVGDRVICLYCNLICQQWTPHTDDPCEVHKTLSPNCMYVKAKLLRPIASSILIVNESAASITLNVQAQGAANLEPLWLHDIVFTAACHPSYSELPKRHASFSTWSNENLPSVDDLARAGFFYTGTQTRVTCFYCNGSLQNWGANDNPMIEHARWFPHCAYAKQLCGDKLYHRIQESNRAQQERVRANESRDGSHSANSNTTTNDRQLVIPDESTLSRLIAARLDLPISQRLLDKKFKLSIIKQCWEDQLRLKGDDFVSDTDLYIACLILQKQIEHIDGKKENIVRASEVMKQIREQNDASSSLATEKRPVQCNDTMEQVNTGTKFTANNGEQDQSSAVLSNPCVLCLKEEKRLAFLPCGHFITCVPCGHSFQWCPRCMHKIEASARVYI